MADRFVESVAGAVAGCLRDFMEEEAAQIDAPHDDHWLVILEVRVAASRSDYLRSEDAYDIGMSRVAERHSRSITAQQVHSVTRRWVKFIVGKIGALIA